MKTCGGCFHYRGGRCKNEHASTYNVLFPSNSQGCQMQLSRILLPFGVLLKWIVIIVGVPLMFISANGIGSILGEGSSSHDDFDF